MSDHTGNTPPIIDTRTCREKQDVVNHNLFDMIDAVTRRCAALVIDVHDLRDRIAALEAMHPDDDDDYETYEDRLQDRISALEAGNKKLRAALEAQHATVTAATPPPASTATANQSYTWLPGDPWSQYTEEVNNG